MTQAISIDFPVWVIKSSAASALSAGEFLLGTMSLHGRSPWYEETMQEEAMPHGEATCRLPIDSPSL